MDFHSESLPAGSPDDLKTSPAIFPAPRRWLSASRTDIFLKLSPEAVATSFLMPAKQLHTCASPFASHDLNSPNSWSSSPRRHSGRGRPFLQLQQVPEGRGSVLLRRFKAAVCQPSKLPKPSPLQLPGATQAAADLSCSSNKFLRPWQRLFMDVQGCRLPALKTPQTLPCSSQAPLKAAADLSCSSNKSLRPWQRLFMDVQGCRLPALKNSPNPSLQLPGATQAAADLSCSSNKSLRPWQCPFKEVQGCRLPAFKTTQTLPCSSQAPLRPRQTFPAAPTSPWGRGSVLLRRFKAAVCQPSKLPKPSPAAPRRHSGRGRPFLQLQQVPWGRGSVLF